MTADESTDPAEDKAVRLLQQLKDHCQRERLPLLALVGLVESQSMARARCDQSGMSREIFEQTVHELLNPDGN